jgi:hypothetical protein
VIPGSVLTDPAAAPDPAYGGGGAPTIPDMSAQYNTAINNALASNNPFQRIAGYAGGQVAGQEGLSGLGAASAEAQYELNNAQLQESSLYNNELAGYQLGQLGISQQQLGIRGTGLQEQQQLLGVEQPIQQSGLVGGLAAAGALNTKGSRQQQQLLGAQQQYSNEELANAQKNLGLLAQSNGMSQQEVMNQLSYMTATGNIENVQNPIDLLTQLGQIWEGGLSGAENVLSPLGFAQNLNLFPGQP